MNSWIRFETMFSRAFTFNPNSEVWILVLVLVVVLVLDQSEAFSPAQERPMSCKPFCSVSLIAKRSGFSRTKDDDEHEDESSNSELGLNLKTEAE